ncbi:MAG: hypothetical protein ACK5HZ_00975 [Macellibacteroides fermentans]|uniref:hypothetical protein n=1 Tax=Macellibacteroides fermentans TaxID=879969 RepID=UPI003AD37292
MTKKKEIDIVKNQTINAVVVNMDKGSIKINNSIITSGQNNTVTISDETKVKINDIINKIEKLSQEVDEDRTDIALVIAEIREKLNRKASSPIPIRMALNVIKGISSKFIDKGIEIMVKEAIELLV